MKTWAAIILVAVSLLPATPGATANDGRMVYAQTCAHCHANGVAGAPKTGDKAAWAPRIAIGRAAMITTVLKGTGAMPPKGGYASLSDEEAKAATDYMLSQLK